MPKVSINGRTVEVPAGATLLDAARHAGVYLPTLCHHPRLPSHAVCRMCLVEVAGRRQPQPACVTPASEGDRVTTDSPALQAFRQADASWLLARHPNDCMRCEVNGSCALQRLVGEQQWEERWPHAAREGALEGPRAADPPMDHTSPSIWRDSSKCIECGLCVEACGDAGQQLHVIDFAGRGSERHPVTAFDRPLAETPCISCGQCTAVCPAGALIEAPHWHDVLHTLDARRRVCVVQVAPATRIAISEEFGLAPGTVSTGRLIHTLRALGFDYVFDTNFAADLTVMEEGTELLARLKRGRVLPLFTSCCPGWVNWVELHRPELLPHLSTTKSPQQMHGALAKRGPFARALEPKLRGPKPETYVVSIMPCTAKKDEAVRPGMSGDVDRVLTTRELARMIRARGIAFAALPEDASFDNPLGESTGAGQVFGASGGVMEAMLRTVSHLAGLPEAHTLDWHALRGVDEGVKTAEVCGLGKVAVCNGIAAAQRLFETEDWRGLVAVEVMACAGGCLGGGGEPKSADPNILRERARAIYAVDARAPRRRAHENPGVQALYADELERPGSSQAHALLHTSYAARGSARSLLMRLLDAVDARDGARAARLFHADGVWCTGSSAGDIHGAAHIEAFILGQLPPRQHGPALARHRMASAGDPDDLTVLTPSGERCHFTLELEASSDAGTPGVIKKLTRTLQRA